MPPASERTRRACPRMRSRRSPRRSRAFTTATPTDPQSYFALAGQHWYPPPNECKHHNDLYLPWHRVSYEAVRGCAAQRAGCADVTLPFWDITAAAARLPFPAAVRVVHLAHRNLRATIPGRVHHQPLRRTRRLPSRFTERDPRDHRRRHDEVPVGDAHHRRSGRPTTRATRRAGRAWRRPDVAAFDPIFWFFHSNWDRLWWEWQKIMQATAYWTFRSTIFGSPAFLQAPLNTLSPFTETGRT